MTSMQDKLFSAEATKVWLLDKKEEILKHPAWHGSTSTQEAESLLLERLPFTYLLRHGERNYHYYLSFIREQIIHQLCVLEFSLQGWVYRNGITSPPQLRLVDLIPLAMHCRPDQCIPLIKG